MRVPNPKNHKLLAFILGRLRHGSILHRRPVAHPDKPQNRRVPFGNAENMVLKVCPRGPCTASQPRPLRHPVKSLTPHLSLSTLFSIMYFDQDLSRLDIMINAQEGRNLHLHFTERTLNFDHLVGLFATDSIMILGRWWFH